ncbi:putative membrane protein [Candidatus Nanobsidianus stetteri]|uniref:Putative membrane protein n=1 Tax=Nanobsidianus stetteri TaxID=1294122 RepID=R1GA17_NANST|nr:putative membrane protein [Candidatus Nanobsidianus stetteri]
MNAPLPNFNDLGEDSPLLVELNNGSLMMLWAGTPPTPSNFAIMNITSNTTSTSEILPILNNLTILLQASILNNNVWGPVINLTNNGDALSYASDGNYIYLVYEPTLSLTYNNTILEELTLSGNVIKSLNIPGILDILSANNGLVTVQFLNGTIALVNMNNGSIEFVNTTYIGFVGNSLYQFYNGVLTINQNLTLNLPIYESAFPILYNNGYVIIAWRPGLLSIYYWNGTELQPIINYTTQFTIIPKASILNNDLYLAWFGLNNISTGQGSIYMAITPLPYQISQYTNITTINITNNTINNTSNNSTISTSNTSYNSIQSTTSNKSLFSSIPIWVIIIVVGVVVFIILY